MRRTVLGVGGVAAAGALGLVVRDRNASPTPSPSTTTTATVSADGRMPTAQVEGVTVYLAPDPPDEALLPRYPDAARLKIPRHLGPADLAIRAELGPGGGVAEPLRAVFLVVAEGGGYHPVLFAPDAPFQVEVPARAGHPVGGRAVGARARGRSPTTGTGSSSRSPAGCVVLDAQGRLGGHRRGARPHALARGLGPRPHHGRGPRARRRLADRPEDRRGAQGPQRGEPGLGRPRRRATRVRELRTFSGTGELTGIRPAARRTRRAEHDVGVEHRGLGGRGRLPPGRLPGRGGALAGPGRGALRPAADAAGARRDRPARSCRRAPTGRWAGARATSCCSSRVRRERVSRASVRRVLAWDVNEGRLYQVADVDRAARAAGRVLGHLRALTAPLRGRAGRDGRVGSSIHSLHDPTYGMASMPAVCSARAQLGRGDARAARRADRGVAVHPDDRGRAAAPRRRAGSGRRG